MLENYYDVKKADEFDRLFGHLAIGQNPTPLHNRYFILRWDFSAVQTHGTSEQLAAFLYDHINGSIEIFKSYYRNMLDYPIELDKENGLRSFQSLLAAVQATPYPLYLFIDEYDNFANEVLMAEHHGARERYLDLVEGEGILKSLFKVIKYTLGGQGLERVFITGVSPVALNDTTSGFNIVENITMEPDLHELCGFREDEIATVLAQVGRVCEFSSTQVQDALTMMRTFYNGYRFVANEPTLVYNPTLVLYFLKHLQNTCHYPEEMLDDNLAMDRQKLAYIAHLPHGKQAIATSLNEPQPLTLFSMAKRFGVHDIFHGDKDAPFLASLLYYLGVLTLGGHTPQGKLLLPIPNLVVRSLYVERMRTLLLPKGTSYEAVEVADDFYITGNMGAVCTFIEQTYFTVFDNRDYRWTNELSIKIIFLTLLYQSKLYIMDSEPALQREYADLIMLLKPDMRQYELLDFLMEFKYVSLAEVGKSGEQVRNLNQKELAALPAVAKKQQQAQTKLAGYRATLHAKYSDRLRLRCFSVVAVGYERLVWVEMAA
jgi:hypothetical protein